MFSVRHKQPQDQELPPNTNHWGQNRFGRESGARRQGKGKTGPNNGTQLSVSVKFLRQHYTNTVHAQCAAQCRGGDSTSCIHVFCCVYTPLSTGAETVGCLGSPVSWGLELERPPQATPVAPAAVSGPMEPLLTGVPSGAQRSPLTL